MDRWLPPIESSQPSNRLWRPIPDSPQTEALDCPADELFFGGSAGGGKSWLLIGLALTRHRKSIIFRREYPQLKDIVQSTHELLGGTRARYNTNDAMWRAIPGGRTLEFGAVQYEHDVNKYKGRAHDLKCVEVGTLIQMADGSTLPIEKVRVNDYVATLDGAHRVTRTLRMGIENCVRITALIDGQEASQVQSVRHAILTDEGWLSYDTSCELRPFSIFLPILPHCDGKYSELSSQTYATLLPPRLHQLLNRPQIERWPQYPAGYLSWWDSPAYMAYMPQETCSAGLNESISTHAPPVLCHPLSPRQSALGSQSTVSWMQAQLCGNDKIDEDCEAALQDYRENCLFCTHPYDAHPHQDSVVALMCLPQSEHAEGQSPTCCSEDYQERTHKHNRCREWYAHPYAMKMHRSSVETVRSLVRFTPVGGREVIDLTVDSANHYITGSGFVNKNCFDEVGELSEYQYRFLTGWLRTTIPGQRVRVVCTGNPPTHAEGEWVIRYWAPWLDGQHPNPARPGELRWFTVLDGRDTEVADGKPFQHKGETVYPRSRTFIPARLTDNPYLASTDYGSVLQALPEPLRTQLLYGDFSVGVKDDPWQVIPTEWVRLAQARWMERADPGAQSALGVDVARGGDDQTVIAPRYGTWFAPLEKHPGISTPDGQRVAALILAARRGSATVNVDVIGVGASVYDQLAQYPGVRGINFGEGTEFTDKSGRLRFANVRAYAYWSLREALDPATGQGLALPIDNELLADLTAPKWTLRGGRIYVESKQEIIKRLHRSPDCGDAVALALIADREIVAAGEMVNDLPSEIYKSKRRSVWQ